MKWLFRALLILVVCCGCSTSMVTETVEADFPATEEPFYAPDFTLRDLDGTTYTLSRLQGQWIVVNFWATWCLPCAEEMPALQTIASGGDVVVLGINMRESEEDIQAFMSKQDIHFPVLLAPSDELLISYSVIGLPQTLIVTPEGDIIYRSFGPLELEKFQQLLDELIKS